MPPEKPKPSEEPEPDDPDDDFGDRLNSFSEMGFDPLIALALAWNKVSPADVRERYLKKGASHEDVARILA